MDVAKIAIMLAMMASGCLAAPSEDLIRDLPGLSWVPTFNQYSGYLQTSGTKKLHYWFTESEGDRKSDPLVLWLNGGPGCSSLVGLLTENGPFRVGDDGKSLTKNPYAWNKIANVVFLEAPAGVGFSYSDDGNYETNDDITAEDNHLALKAFFEKFPEYRNHDFYITGESYAGVYIPTLASVVLNDKSINLKGFAVGNGLSDVKKNHNSLVYFLKYHGAFGEDVWQKLWKSCCPQTCNGDYCDFVEGASRSSNCSTLVGEVKKLTSSSGLNPYNFYAEKPGGVYVDPTLNYDSANGVYVSSNFGYPFMFLDSEVTRKYKRSLEIRSSRMKRSVPVSDILTTYLNSADTRNALHIPHKVQEFETCNPHLGYTRIYQSVKPQYLEAINSNKLRIFVYNGDVDMACNYLGGEWFVDDLGIDDPLTRRSWHYTAEDGTKQVAGYLKEFPNANLTFLTVKGSGHFVPADKPIPALKMFRHFLSGQPLS